jgi:hypothetical protein
MLAMTDRRPDRVYGIIVRDSRVFLCRYGDHFGLPGGIFRPLAEDRKAEVRGHLLDQLGIMSRAVWAQGAFIYHHPAEEIPQFSGFYTVREWDGGIPGDAGEWFGAEDLAGVNLEPALRVLLLSVMATQAVHTR